MKRKTLILLMICFFLATPNLIERMKKEAGNDLQLIVPYEEMNHVAKKENLPLDDALKKIQQLGVHSLSLAPITLKTLAADGEVLIYDQMEFAKLKENPSLLKGEDGTYVFLPLHSNVETMIQINQLGLPIFLDEKKYYFLPLTSEQAESIPLGYDQDVLDKITTMGFHYHLALPASDKFDQESLNLFMNKTRPNLSAFLFSGNTVPGYPNKAAMEELAETFLQRDIPWLFPELHQITGIREFAQAMNYQLYRIHSLNLTEMEANTAIDRAVRAIKERKISAIYLHLPLRDESPLEATTAFIEHFKKKIDYPLSREFREPLKQSTHLLISLLAFAAAIIFTYTVTQHMNPLGQYLLIALNFSLASGYILFSKIIFLQFLLFFLVILTPIYAFILIKNTSKTKITYLYLQTIFIHLIGIVCIISLSNDIRLLVGIEVFRFVKLAYLLPISMIAIYFLQGSIKAKFWRKPITYQNLSLLLLFFMVTYFYVTRTGNSGFILPFELSLRQSLEDLLYIRPRTKEFLIGFPAFIFSLHLLKIGKKKWAAPFLITGAIGFTSLLNTFLHFHIPVDISILRSVYSILFGYFIGRIVILLFEKTRRYLQRG